MNNNVNENNKIECLYDNVDINTNLSGKQNLSSKKKKITFVILIVLLVIGLLLGLYYFKNGNLPFLQSNENSTNNSDEEKIVSLDELSNTFNNLSMVKKNNDFDGFLETSTVENGSFVITINTDTVTRIVFDVNDNILSKDEKDNSFTVLYYFYQILISKAVLDGYDENSANQLVASINNRTNMTLENNGIEIINNDDSSVSMKLDLSKKIIFPDVSNVYVMKEDLDNFKDVIGKQGSVNGVVGNIHYYYKYEPNFGNEMTILISEPNELTELTYNSLLTFIEYIFGSNELESFKTLYPEIKNASFGKYKITINPVNEDYNSYYTNGNKVLEVIITMG